MGSFSPKTYQIYQYDDTNLSQISYYYNCFTLLEKPEERNVYKVSLAQMLHYMFDFGIGYNSKCVTTLTTQQQFATGRYVNRHATLSPKRPATVADLKRKILDVVEALVKRSVKYPYPNGNLISKINTIFPKYLFTLDSSLTTLKLKQMTGHDYVEMTDFENFAYASDSSVYTMPQYNTGYVPVSAVRCVPVHSHNTHQDIKKSISYSWSAKLSPQGNSAWAGKHLFNISCSYNSHSGPVDPVGKVGGANHSGAGGVIDCVASMSPSWDKPSGVSCFENEEKDPVNTVSNGESKVLSIRYHGRRYKLFKRVD